MSTINAVFSEPGDEDHCGSASSAWLEWMMPQRTRKTLILLLGALISFKI